MAIPVLTPEQYDKLSPYHETFKSATDPVRPHVPWLSRQDTGALAAIYMEITGADNPQGCCNNEWIKRLAGWYSRYGDTE